MKVSISDLAFPGFSHGALQSLPGEFGLELFVEFGTRQYWDYFIPRLIQNRTGSLSFHGSCAAINLSNPDDPYCVEELRQNFEYAQKVGAHFVVVHTNEGLGNAAKNPDMRKNRQKLVRERLAALQNIASHSGVPLVIENVGLRIYDNVLFTYEEYLELLADFPQARALIDTGHAHVNGWNIPACIEALGDRLIAFHLHDNDGNADAHQPIGNGTIDWDPVLTAVKTHAPQAQCVLEYVPMTMPALLEHLEQLQKQYQLF